MRVKKVKIKHETWTFKLVSEKTLNKHFGDDWAAAFVEPKNHRAYFCKEDFSIDIVRHELWHVFFSHTYTDSATLDAAQVEEVSADLFAAQGKEMWELADFIYKSLLEE